MTPEYAVGLINGSLFRPGWTLKAIVYTTKSVYVYARIQTVDTSYPPSDRTGTWPVEMTMDPDVIIDVSKLDEAGLAYAILTKLVAQIDSHENREFLQFRSATNEWYAPLHPHTADGQLDWTHCEMRSLTAAFAGI
jgi:hypothetical protein